MTAFVEVVCMYVCLLACGHIYLNVTFNCADLINLAVLNTPRLVCINFSIFNRNHINALLEFINCEYLF